MYFPLVIPPELILMPDLADGFRTQFYDCAAVRTGEFVILLVQVYHMDRTQIDIQLLASRDGKNFVRVADRRVFTLLGNEGEFNGGMISPAPPIEYDDKLWIYAGCSPYPHQYEPEEKNVRKVYLYQLRCDGYVSFCAGDEEGSLMSRRMDWIFDEIRINGRTAKDGYIAIELYDGCTGGWAGEGLWTGNHIGKSYFAPEEEKANVPGGGNALFCDGHVEWKSMDKAFLYLDVDGYGKHFH